MNGNSYKAHAAPHEPCRSNAVTDDGYSQEEAEFIKAVMEYQRKYDRKFPTFVEVLRIAKSLGYRKVDEVT